MSRTRIFKDPDNIAPTGDIDDLPGLLLWLDAKDPLNTGVQPADGVSLGTWTDRSGNGHNATQGALQPVWRLSGPNQLPSVEVGQASLGYSVPTLTAISGDYTVFLVSQQSNNTGGTFDGVYLFDSNGSIRLTLNQQPTPNVSTDFLYFNGAFNGASLGTLDFIQSTYSFNATAGTGQVRRSMVDIFSGPYSSTSLGSVTIGQRYTGESVLNYQGFISEVIIYDRTLTPGEIDIVEEILKTKWGF